MRVRATVGMWLVACAMAATVDASADGALIAAAKNRDGETVRALLRQKVDVNAQQPDGATALHWAAHWNDLETAAALIQAGANVNAANQLGVAPLYLACENGSSAMVDRLLRAGANPNASLPSGETALMTAARAGSVEVIQSLIARGADVQARERMDGQTALMWTISQRHARAAEVRVGAGADVTARSAVRRQAVVRGERGGGSDRKPEIIEEGGFTPLLFASRAGDVASARLLVAHGANVNDAAPSAASALVVAIHSGQTDVAMFLLETGCDPNAHGAGYFPLHAAVLRNDLTVMRALLARGANPNAIVTQGTPVGRQTKYFAIDASMVGATPFLLAAKYAEAPAMRLLLEAGADANIGLKDGTTPLMVAAGMHTLGLGRISKDRRDRDIDSAENDMAYSQDEDIRAIMNSGLDAVKICIENGADVNAVNATTGDTALHAAARHGFKTVIQFLAAPGARLDIKNNRGQTSSSQLNAVLTSDADADIKKTAADTIEFIKTLASRP